MKTEETDFGRRQLFFFLLRHRLRVLGRARTWSISRRGWRTVASSGLEVEVLESLIENDSVRFLSAKDCKTRYFS